MFNSRSLLINLLVFVVILITSLRIANVNAKTQSALNEIKQLAITFARSQISPPLEGELRVKAVNLDPRIKIVSCEQGYSTSLPGKQNFTHRITVLIRCDAKNWQLYIPVELQLLSKTVVASRPLARGEILNKHHLSIKILDNRFTRNQTYSSIETIIGSKVKRRIALNSPITKNVICMVCKDDEVLINAHLQGIKIAAKGSAISDGTLGEKIEVRNIRSNKVVAARVSAIGKVVVD